jgi:prepilin-type N-terminal cleavage/methylation domain-containing protein
MHREDGFSLVELLVVMIVIGILAAIALPSYLGHRTKAADASAQSDATAARKAMRIWELQNGAFDARPKDLVAIEPSLASAASLKTGRGATSFWVQTSSSSGNVFRVTRAGSGRVTRDCGQSKVGKKRGLGGCRKVADPAGNYW